MVEAEEYFPRGGKKPIVTHFKQSSNFLGAPDKGEKKRKKPKKKSEPADGYLSEEETNEVDTSFVNCAIGLNYKIVKKDLLVLGRVCRVYETKVILALPCKMTGCVMACHISESYNKLLEAYVNDKVDKICELSDMFRPGQYVAAKVLEVDGRNLMLSMMPQHLNGGKLLTDLQNGTLLQAAVSSVEDHGYVMDIGISNTRAFLPTSNTNPEIKLETGMITWCCIKSVSPSSENSVVTLSNELIALQNTILRRKPTTPLLPATAFACTVDKPLDNGIEGHIFQDTTAYIQRQHADSVKGKKPKLGQKIRAYLLYVMPTRNTPFLTMKNIFEISYPDLVEEQKFREGDIIEEAQVIKITRRLIIFRLGRGSVGAMSVRRVHHDEELTDEQIIAKSYPIGSTHKVRVVCYYMCDYMYCVSDEPAVLAEQHFRLEQLCPGQLLQATVSTVTDQHLKVTVGNITGVVTKPHMSDVGVFLDPKRANNSKLPHKKFKEGQEVKARVLAIDLMNQKVCFTLKPSLLAPDLEVLQSYHEAQKGKQYTGTIKFIRDYVLVSFFNNVQAFVSRSQACRETDVNLVNIYHLGQIVNCTILWVDPEANKMAGSLTMPPFTPRDNYVKPEKREHQPGHAEVPNKKQKTIDNNEKVEGKKDKKNKIDKHISDKLDEKQDEVLDGEDAKSERKKKKKDKKMSEDVTGESEAMEIDLQEGKKKKKKKDNNETKEISGESDGIETDIQEDDKKKKKNKNQDKNINGSAKVSEEGDHLEVDIKQARQKKEKKEKTKELSTISAGSDPIDTDIQESDYGLTPQEIGLMDLSDCVTAKNYKKRVVSLLKAIKARMLRFDRIQLKITKSEEKGLNASNKKYHTAMHTEKLVLEQRLKQLMDTLKIAQEKLKEFNIETPIYKKKDLKQSKETEEDKKVVKEEVKEDVKKEKKINKYDIKVVESLEPALEVPSAKDFWSTNMENVSKVVGDESGSSSSDEEKQEQPKKKRKKLTAAEKVAKAREEEERVRQLERRAIESESRPQSSEQFERALLASPDSSQLWIAYMAFHLQATELDKARAVGRRALNTISFREEQEKLNVWLAIINIENRFGTKESQQKVLEEALQMNEPFHVHSKLLDIYVETSKQQELSSLVELMMKRYRRQVGTYTACGEACYKAGLVDKARHVMQKAIASLEKKEHVSVLVQFALLERVRGSPERGEALFEQVLAVYPQRVDVCCVYVDTLLKANDLDKVRQVMERMTSQKLAARKMKVLYKKWIEVEEKYGDKQQAETVRQHAIEYINAAKF